MNKIYYNENKKRYILNSVRENNANFIYKDLNLIIVIEKIKKEM
jgi:hypothetical protein